MELQPSSTRLIGYPKAFPLVRFPCHYKWAFSCHSKNFSFLYDDAKFEWHLSPAYDLTYSSSLAGQHATTVAGNGENPSIADIMRVVQGTDLDTDWASDTAQCIHDVVTRQLEEYLRLK